MKSFMLFVCLFFAAFFNTKAGDPPATLDIDYEISAEIFTATTDDSNDRLVSIRAYDSGNVLRAEKTCNLSMVCTINLSPLPAGNYNVKVFSQYDNIVVPVTLN
jgi:hypothetical protein